MKTTFETRSPDWLSVDEAVSRILSRANRLSTEEIDARDAAGRVLAEGILARAALPPWDNSAMDGYAVRGRDVEGASTTRPVVLRVVGETRAGDTAGRALTSGEAVRIMTGAPIPPGSDTVIRVEDTDAEVTPGKVRILSTRDIGRHIRPGGQDMREGEEVLKPGIHLGPGQMGVLAASGARRVRVYRRPRIAILSNGDELAAAEDFQRVLRGKAIPETNAPTLATAVSFLGATPIPLGIARDERASILEKVALAREEEADVLLTSGGASLGEKDLFKRVLEEIDFHLDFWRVKMRPGTPFSFGYLPDPEKDEPLAVFGLPGNPASSFVTFQVFARPFIAALAGHDRIHRPVIRARAGESLTSESRLTHFFRVVLRGDPAFPDVFLTGPQTSGLVRGQGRAHGLAVIPEGVGTVEAGDPLRVILLDERGLGGEEPGYLPSS
jgi:molybdopterin molybdotransferase